MSSLPKSERERRRDVNVKILSEQFWNRKKTLYQSAVIPSKQHGACGVDHGTGVHRCTIAQMEAFNATARPWRQRESPRDDSDIGIWYGDVMGISWGYNMIEPYITWCNLTKHEIRNHLLMICHVRLSLHVTCNGYCIAWGLLDFQDFFKLRDWVPLQIQRGANNRPRSHSTALWAPQHTEALHRLFNKLNSSCHCCFAHGLASTGSDLVSSMSIQGPLHKLISSKKKTMGFGPSNTEISTVPMIIPFIFRRMPPAAAPRDQSIPHYSHQRTPGPRHRCRARGTSSGFKLSHLGITDPY